MAYFIVPQLPCKTCYKLSKPLRKGECCACANRRYYQESEIIRAKKKANAIKWEKNNRKRRNKIVERWKQKRHIGIHPDVKEFQRAIKRLEKVLENTKNRERVCVTSK